MRTTVGLRRVHLTEGEIALLIEALDAAIEESPDQEWDRDAELLKEKLADVQRRMMTA